MNTKSQAIAERIDPERAGGMEIAAIGGGSSLIVRDMAQVMEFAKMMSVSDIAVRKHLRNSPGACLAVAMQALRWGMDPYAVGNKSYVVNDQLAYESQLIAAVVNTRANIEARPSIAYEGKDNTRRCIITGYIKGDPEPRVYQSPPVGGITTKNSPLWKSDPDQQLYYFSIRAWARRHVPEVLLGIYAEDELGDLRERADRPAEIAPPRPERVDDLAPVETESEDKFDLLNPWGEVMATLSPGEFLDEINGSLDRKKWSADEKQAFFEFNVDTLRAIENATPGVDGYEFDGYVATLELAYGVNVGIPKVIDGKPDDLPHDPVSQNQEPKADDLIQEWRAWIKSFLGELHECQNEGDLYDLESEHSDKLNDLLEYSETARKHVADQMMKRRGMLAQAPAA